MLIGVPVTTKISPKGENYANYILADGEEFGIGFYPLSDEKVINQGEAYLQLPVSQASDFIGLGGYTDDYELCDVNKDGKVDVADIVTIIDKIAEKSRKKEAAE